MDNPNSLLLQRVAVFRSQIKQEKILPRPEAVDAFVAELEKVIRAAQAAAETHQREKEALMRQNQELTQRITSLSEQKSRLEHSLQATERHLKTLERHNTNLLRQNQQIQHTNAALEEKHVAAGLERQRLRDLFEYAPEAYLLTDITGTILDCNYAAAEMLNSPVRDIKGENLAHFIAASYRSLFATLLTRLQRIKDVEICLSPRGQGELDATITLSTFFDEGTGKPALLHWMLRDITERRRAMAALNASERRFRTVFNEASLGILLIDLEGKIIRANRAMQDMLGYSEVELFNRSIQDLACAEDAPVSNVWLTLPESGAGNFFLENRFRRRDGQYIWTSLSLSVLREENGQPQYMLAMVKNIGAEKQTAAELAELRRKLLESGEVERLRLAQVLHDGPTQDLYSANFMLSNFMNGGSPQATGDLKPLQDTLRTVANHLRDIVGELRPPTIGNLGLERAIRSHAERLQEEHPELEIRLHLTRDGQTLPPHTRLAFFRIYQQCIANILRHSQATRAIIAFHLDEKEFSLDIWDNGKGFVVPAKWVDLVREGHYGLATIAEQVQALGGELTIESKANSGTLVHITAPKNPQAA